MPPVPAFDLSAIAQQRLVGGLAPDVLIFGGGVNGVATLRDLALNGVSAVLLDQGDFAAGASSASTRMAHGGLRYLEGREFRLVAEAARERNLLLRNAPHLVRPLEIVVPLDAFAQGLGRAGMRFAGLSQKAGPMSLIALKAGLVLYERFGAVERVLPRHSATTDTRQFPSRLRKDTKAVVRYFDGQISNPEGLMFEMLDEAMQNPRVAALNHTAWRFLPDGGVEVALPGGPVTLRPRVILNATGAWIDVVNARLGLQTGHVRGVKGAHLVLRHPALLQRMAGSAYYFDDGRGRMVICLPLAETILMGTTEIEVASPDDKTVAGDEVDYLLAALSRLFDDITVTRADLVAVTTGIRPLQAGGGSANRAARDHALAEDALPDGRPVLSLVGGKWTTFRSFAEMTADRTLALLGKARKTSTRDLRYPGAGAKEVMGRRYGAQAAAVAAFIEAGEDRPIKGHPGYSRREILWLIHARAAMTLEDLILRRTQLALGAHLRLETVEDLATILANARGQGQDWAATQLAKAKADPRILALRHEAEETVA